MRWVVCFVALLTCGCGAYFTGAGHDAAQGAVNAVTSDDSKKKLMALETNAIATATDDENKKRLTALVTALTKAAREDALGPETSAAIQKLVKETGITTRAELDQIITAKLQDKLRETVRKILDEALGPATVKETGVLREELLGKPAQDDVNALIDAAAPHLAAATQQAVQAALVPVKSETDSLRTAADSEAAKWKPIAIGFGVGGGCLLLCVVVLTIALRSHRKVIESHQKVIETLAARPAKEA